MKMKLGGMYLELSLYVRGMKTKTQVYFIFASSLCKHETNPIIVFSHVPRFCKNETIPNLHLVLSVFIYLFF